MRRKVISHWNCTDSFGIEMHLECGHVVSSVKRNRKTLQPIIPKTVSCPYCEFGGGFRITPHEPDAAGGVAHESPDAEAAAQVTLNG